MGALRNELSRRCSHADVIGATIQSALIGHNRSSATILNDSARSATNSTRPISNKPPDAASSSSCAPAGDRKAASEHRPPADRDDVESLVKSLEYANIAKLVVILTVEAFLDPSTSTRIHLSERRAARVRWQPPPARADRDRAQLLAVVRFLAVRAEGESCSVDRVSVQNTTAESRPARCRAKSASTIIPMSS
jgi:hypothetical protein